MVYLPGVVDSHPSTPPPQQRIVAGYVSNARPAPVTFDDPVWVIVPSHGVDTPYGPVAWPAAHGLAMPVQGSPIWLAFDADGAPVVVWWTASYLSSATTFVAGSGPPTAGVGSSGAIYLDFTGLALYGPKTTAWPASPFAHLLPTNTTWAQMP